MTYIVIGAPYINFLAISRVRIWKFFCKPVNVSKIPVRFVIFFMLYYGSILFFVWEALLSDLML